MVLVKHSYHLFILTLLGLYGCGKKEFLDKKPRTDIVIPTTLEDFRKLLDNDRVMKLTPNLGEVSSGDYYISHSYWQTLTVKEKNGYLWASDIYEGQEKIEDWDLPYSQVLYANVVLDGLSKVPVTSANAIEWNNIKGNALFNRSYAFYNIARVFAPVYDLNTANRDLGIPLRLTPNVDEKSVRSTVEQTYDQILSDLIQSSRILPDSLEYLNRNRPSKPAAFALLARVYLSMRNYEKAGEFADSSLRYYRRLIDFDTVSRSAPLSFNILNVETLYQSRMLTTSKLFNGTFTLECIVDSVLFKSYNQHDLRLEAYFTKNSRGLPITKGTYSGTAYSFSGLATDEVYLIRAECLARAGNVSAAMNDLNTLMRCRWRKNHFNPITASSAAEALDLILQERRRELLFRGVRFDDIRRLNKEGYNISLRRELNGQTYSIPPGDPRFVLPIPPDVIRMTGMQQNPR